MERGLRAPCFPRAGTLRLLSSHRREGGAAAGVFARVAPLEREMHHEGTGRGGFDATVRRVRAVPMTVRDLMTNDVQTLGRNDELSVADDLMAQRRIRHLPVLDEDGTLVGIVSQRDMFRGALAQALGYGTSAQQRLLAMLVVKEIMTTDVVTVRPEAPIVTAAAPWPRSPTAPSTASRRSSASGAASRPSRSFAPISGRSATSACSGPDRRGAARRRDGRAPFQRITEGRSGFLMLRRRLRAVPTGAKPLARGGGRRGPSGW
jgi:CBS domain-containing protein